MSQIFLKIIHVQQDRVQKKILRNNHTKNVNMNLQQTRFPNLYA